MSFRLTGLPMAPFHELTRLGDEALRARGVRRMTAEAGEPCRVSLADARAGETLYLLTWVHHDVAGPFRSAGPIFVRETAEAARLAPQEVPAGIRSRLLSVRGYDREGMMTDAEVVEGTDAGAVIARMFGDTSIRYLHLHYARRGCYACRVDRA